MRKASVALIGVFALVLAAIASTGGSVATGANTVNAAQNYIVLWKANNVPANAATTIQQAGGTLVHSYDQIGVAIASSSSASFGSNLSKADKSVESAAATTRFAVHLDDAVAAGAAPPELPNAPAADADSLSPLQWDMRQIHTPEAHAITGGSRTVLVGDIDTGLDHTHPDLAPNVDFANSVSCVGGVPNQSPAAWMDDNGHGTHTAGTIAAAANGIGIVGVAPNVRIAGIKAGNADGFFFPEAVVCSFMWAGTHGIDVTNNSYFADPWLFNCKNDPGQRAIWKAEQRAIQFAQKKGVTVVASEGNMSEDISHPSQDVTSPDDTTPVVRPITNACIVIPVEIPGVIGVTANGNATQVDGDDDPNDYLKSYYSSFGISEADVVAPGGDRRFGVTAAATVGGGRVLSTWPGSLSAGCPIALRITEATGVYCYLQGTSMAGPHVAGVAALIISRFGTLAGPNDATMTPNKVAARVGHTADPQPCPTDLPTTNPADGRSYLSFLGVDDGKVQRCEGGPNHNSWYGDGQVNALSAITK
jgi:subtilisin family serine protease